MSVRIKLYSDFVCPFCFIAEESSLVRLQREFDVEVEWRGFQLHPQTPEGGVPLSNLFGARAPAMRAHVAQFAQGFGVQGMMVPDHLSNTRRALALAEWARDEGKLEAFRHAATEAYWRRGEDLEDEEVLARLAVEAGLSAEGARAALRSPEYKARVDAMGQEARRDGVTGIPTFLIGGSRVVGCQPYEVLAEAARLAGAQPRRE
ncbi:DsbA family oxidoreductase [Myxococcaceae bacterium GXIMD 01537]